MLTSQLQTKRHLILLLMMLPFLCSSSGKANPRNKDNMTSSSHAIRDVFSFNLEEEPETAPTDTTIFPNDDQLKLIGRLAEGIHNWKTKREHNGWWECGEFTQAGVKTQNRALAIAYQIVRSSFYHSQQQHPLETKTREVNVWGLAGTIANESAFDRCAVGYYFRKWAIKKKLLKPKKRCISYKEAELLAALQTPKAKRVFSQTGVDVGYCQLLSRFHQGAIAEQMHATTGIDICAKHFALRSRRLKTSRPWRWWPGSETAWYDNRVVIKARAMGATANEI